MSDKCPRCGSPQPHLHPAVQHEGEVSVCLDEFHLRPTPQNTMSYIHQVAAARKLTGNRSGCSEMVLQEARTKQDVQS